jgi:DNA-binding Lrp family transcriptional regulator
LEKLLSHVELPINDGKGVTKIEAILLVWGVRDEVLEKLPVEGYWLYGEYDFIARVDFRDEFEMEEFS